MSPRAGSRRHRPGRAALPLVGAPSDEDSGPACLASVLASLGRVTTLAEAAERCGESSGGALVDLVEGGHSFGLEMVPLDVDVADLADVPRPALLRWRGRYVVLHHRRRGRWTLLDPVEGPRRVSEEDLRRHFDGSVLTTSPGPHFWASTGHATGGSWRVLGRQVGTTPAFRRLMAAVLALSALILVVGLVGPVLTQLLVDQVLPQAVPGVVPLVAVGLAALALTRFVGDLLRGRLLVLLSGHLDDRLMTSFFGHLLALPYSFFRERSTGDLVQRFSSNATIRNALTLQTVGGLIDGAMVVVYAVALFWLDPTFAVWALGLGALEVAVLVLPARRINALTQQELAEVAATQSFTVEVVTGAAYVKASGLEGGMLAVWARRLHDQLDASMRRRRFATLLAAVSSTLAATSSSVLLLVGVSQVLSGDLTLGRALALISLSGNFLTPLALLISALQQLQSVRGHVDRITSVLALPVEQGDRPRPPIEGVEGRIELRDVGFRYGSDGPWAVRHISFCLEPGQRVAVVGPSGSGKTTLAALVLGLHAPDEGSVLVDGVDLHSRDLGSFRRQCGVVLQDPVVFDGTVHDNVSFHDDHVTDEDVRRAMRMAHLDEDVAAMADGLQTVVGERGAALSGGQRQRLALARALARRPRLLVLDEATGALDTTTEAAVIEDLRQERASTLVIAHRLSTVRDAECIIVLDRGRIVEAGTHDDLVRHRGGHYARLVASGSGAAPGEPAEGDAGALTASS